MTEKAKIAANAVNTLLGLSEKDQSSLLEVLEDYFTAPGEETGPEIDIEDLDYDGDEDRTIVQGIDIIRAVLSNLTIELKREYHRNYELHANHTIKTFYTIKSYNAHI